MRGHGYPRSGRLHWRAIFADRFLRSAGRRPAGTLPGCCGISCVGLYPALHIQRHREVFGGHLQILFLPGPISGPDPGAKMRRELEPVSTTAPHRGRNLLRATGPVAGMPARLPCGPDMRGLVVHLRRLRAGVICRDSTRSMVAGALQQAENAQPSSRAAATCSAVKGADFWHDVHLAIIVNSRITCGATACPGPLSGGAIRAVLWGSVSCPLTP